MTKRRVALLMNPASGQGKGLGGGHKAAHALRDKGLFVMELCGENAEESEALAQDAVEQGIDALVAAGGDGTINLALQAVAQTGTPLGIMPLGTGDDNARGLGIPLKDLDEAASIVADGYSRTVDCGRVVLESGAERFYLGVLSIGFDSQVNERANKLKFPKGESKYIAAILGELAVFKPVEFSIVLDGSEREEEAMLVAFGNGVSYGGGMKVCPDAEFDDGFLDVTILNKVSKFTFIKSFPRVFKGTHTEFPFVQQFRVKTAKVAAEGQTVYADGERVGPVPAQISVVEGAVDILSPR